MTYDGCLVAYVIVPCKAREASRHIMRHSLAELRNQHHHITELSPTMFNVHLLEAWGLPTQARHSSVEYPVVVGGGLFDKPCNAFATMVFNPRRKSRQQTGDPSLIETYGGGSITIGFVYQTARNNNDF
jgi:hypothetical protein